MGEKSFYEQLVDTIKEKGVIEPGDTRFSRMLQLAESERRQRVADSLVRLCTNASELALELNRQLYAFGKNC